MPICSSETQCPLYSAASLGKHVIGPHANLNSHIILTPGSQPFVVPYISTMYAIHVETIAIISIFKVNLSNHCMIFCSQI